MESCRNGGEGSGRDATARMVVKFIGKLRSGEKILKDRGDGMGGWMGDGKGGFVKFSGGGCGSTEVMGNDGVRGAGMIAYELDSGRSLGVNNMMENGRGGGQQLRMDETTWAAGK